MSGTTQTFNTRGIILAPIILMPEGTSFIVPGQESNPMPRGVDSESPIWVQTPSLSTFEPCDLRQVTEHFCGSVFLPTVWYDRTYHIKLMVGIR